MDWRAELSLSQPCSWECYFPNSQKPGSNSSKHTQVPPSSCYSQRKKKTSWFLSDRADSGEAMERGTWGGGAFPPGQSQRASRLNLSRHSRWPRAHCVALCVKPTYQALCQANSSQTGTLPAKANTLPLLGLSALNLAGCPAMASSQHSLLGICDYSGNWRPREGDLTQGSRF